MLSFANFMKWIFFLYVSCLLLSCSTTDRDYKYEDNFSFLETPDAKTQNFIKTHNRIAKESLLSDPSRLKENESILVSSQTNPRMTFVGPYVFKLEKNKRNPRGRLLFTAIDKIGQRSSVWKSAIDFDRLSAKEKIKWSFSKIDCLLPEANSCLVHLSKDGGDKVEVREFDLRKRRFVKKGFRVPIGFTKTAWINPSQIMVATNVGDGTVGSGGLANQVRLISRGQKLTAGKIIFGLQPDYISLYFQGHPYKNSQLVIGSQFASEKKNDFWVLTSAEPQKIPTPKASIFYGIHNDYLVFQCWTPWLVGAKRCGKGDLIGIHIDQAGSKQASEDKVIVLYKARPESSIYSVGVSSKGILVNYLENVIGKIVGVKIDSNQKKQSLRLRRLSGHLRLQEVDYRKGRFLVGSQDYLNPARLSLFDIDENKASIVKTQEASFDSKGMTYQQLWATAPDGVKIPYFVVGKKKALASGNAPTIVFSYGGFGITYTPKYDSLLGKNWLEKGGLYVQAGIRGGGEFGPDWHKAALREKRVVAFDDLIAVLKDLVIRKLTTKSKLGAYSGSNGGYLLGGVMVREPNLLKAVALKVPLFDMLNFHRFLAGSSWVSEYGDPRVSKDRAFLERLSPYQNLSKKVNYPSTFVYTSSSDDRVHPSHARKMAAKLLDYGSEVYFYESQEGGHAGAATLKQQAYWETMMFQFFQLKLGL